MRAYFRSSYSSCVTVPHIAQEGKTRFRSTSSRCRRLSQLVPLHFKPDVFVHQQFKDNLTTFYAPLDEAPMLGPRSGRDPLLPRPTLPNNCSYSGLRPTWATVLPTLATVNFGNLEGKEGPKGGGPKNFALLLSFSRTPFPGHPRRNSSQ